nr:hypothetical protein BaRGS_013298 [Batillaria attramentaria]
MAAVIARNRAIDDLFSRGATRDMWMVLVCMGLQDIVNDCRRIQSFEFGSGGSGFSSFGSPFHGGSSFSSGYGGSSFGNIHQGSGFNNIHPGGSFSTGFGSNNAVICPSPTDQSLVYALNPDSTGYPARLTANATCPFSQLRLWQYQSQAVGGVCWVLQNFQENILYRVCSEKFCLNCKDKRSFGTSLNNINQKLCITDYMTVSLWAYCPSLTPGFRIIRDRIIVPISCTCQSVRCDPVPYWKK